MQRLTGPAIREHLRGFALHALGLWILVLSGSGCDREDLFSGPAGGTVEPPPPPPPPVTDCDDIPSASELRGKLFINEVMVFNESTLADEHGAFPQWIELYNNTDAELNAGGLALSDDLLFPSKWKIPCVPAAKIPARGFLIIYLDDDTDSETDFHASFTLSTTGSFLVVVNKGSNIFNFDATKMAADQSVGRFPDGNSKVQLLAEPTPGEINSEAAAPVEPKEDKFIRGDANDDGRLNVTDMTYIMSVLFHGEPMPRCQDALDANDDGAVNISDSLFLGNALFQQGLSIPPPYPQANVDPTADALPCPLE